MKLSDLELKSAILTFLFKKGRWGRHYFPLESLINWFGKKVERDGKRVKECVKKLVKAEILLVHKKGNAISLNPRKKDLIEKFLV